MTQRATRGGRTWRPSATHVWQMTQAPRSGAAQVWQGMGGGGDGGAGVATEGTGGGMVEVETGGRDGEEGTEPPPVGEGGV